MSTFRIFKNRFNPTRIAQDMVGERECGRGGRSHYGPFIFASLVEPHTELENRICTPLAFEPRLSWVGFLPFLDAFRKRVIFEGKKRP